MTVSSAELLGSTLHPGEASGTVLKLGLPLSFWGGVDGNGRLIDSHHPQHGSSVTGRVLAMTVGRGSSSSSSVLAELLRTGHGPAAIVMAEPDAIVTLGAIVAHELYASATPVVVVDPSDFDGLPDGTDVNVTATDEGATIWAHRQLPRQDVANADSPDGGGGSGRG